MKYCPRCGVPRTLISEHRWDSNGVISLTRDPTHRMVMIDNEALNNILSSISGTIGMELDDIVVEAKRRSGKHFMDAVLSGVKGVIARNLISTKVYQQLSDQIRILGLGSAEVVGYKRHWYLEGVATDTYGPAMLAGDICGAFESVERCVAEVRFDRDDGSVHFVVNRAERERPEYSDRFRYQVSPCRKGNNIFELCPVCRAPDELGKKYSFDMDRGVIHEEKTGHRVVLTGVMTLNNLFGELAAELGGEIPEMIMSIEKERVRDVILSKEASRDTTEKGYMRYLKTLELKGMGNGVFASVSPSEVKVRVHNPYYEPLIAGFLAGFFEATTRRAAAVEWTEAVDGYTDVSIRPA
jgi:hypothetical protein